MATESLFCLKTVKEIQRLEISELDEETNYLLIEPLSNLLALCSAMFISGSRENSESYKEKI